MVLEFDFDLIFVGCENLWVWLFLDLFLMAADELVELKFRLADGSDIGPSKYNSTATVTSLKEKIIAQWPKGFESYSASYVYL